MTVIDLSALVQLSLLPLRRRQFTGERLRAQVIAETGVDPARVVSIPTGIDLERFRPGDAASARAALGLPAPGALVGIVATLRSWKGHRYLLEALAGMARTDVHLATGLFEASLLGAAERCGSLC